VDDKKDQVSDNIKTLSKLSVDELVMTATAENFRALEYKICTAKDQFSSEMDMWRLEYEDNIPVTIDQVRTFDHDTPEFSIISFMRLREQDSLAVWLNADSWGWLRVIDDEWDGATAWMAREFLGCECNEECNCEDEFECEEAPYDSSSYDDAWGSFAEEVSKLSILPLTRLKFAQLSSEALGGYTAQPIGSEAFPVCKYDSYTSTDMTEAVKFIKEELL